MKIFYKQESRVNPNDVHECIDYFFDDIVGDYVNIQEREEFILYALEYLSGGIVKEDVNWSNELYKFVENTFKEE